MTEKHYFADTSFLIDLFNGEERAVEIMRDADSISTGTLVIYELSKISSFDRDKLENGRINELDSDDAIRASELYRRLSEKGEKIGEIDYLIAAQSDNSDRKLVTRDKDFQKLEIETLDYSLE